MAIQRSPLFEKQLAALPAPLRRKAGRAIRLLEQHGPSYPSLRSKRLTGGGGCWEVSVTMNYRLLLAPAAGGWLALRLVAHDGVSGRRLGRLH
jgi:hypothetical protein